MEGSHAGHGCCGQMGQAHLPGSNVGCLSAVAPPGLSSRGWGTGWRSERREAGDGEEEGKEENVRGRGGGCEEEEREDTM